MVEVRPEIILHQVTTAKECKIEDPLKYQRIYMLYMYTTVYIVIES